MEAQFNEFLSSEEHRVKIKRVNSLNSRYTHTTASVYTHHAREPVAELLYAVRAEKRAGKLNKSGKYKPRWQA